SCRRVELWIDSLGGSVQPTGHPDQPWKIARMNKFTFALALGAGLVLSLAAPSAQASPVQASTIQDLAPVTMSAAQFNSEFTPINGNSPLSKPFTFINTTDTAGTVQSQVFQGTGKAAGIYAYAYQFDVNPNVKDSTGQPIA